MSVITNIGKSVRSHLVKELAASGEGQSEPDTNVTSAISAAAETEKGRSHHSAKPRKYVTPEGQEEPGFAVLGSDAMDVTGTNLQKKTSKQEIVLGLLQRDEGATIDELIDATAWQAHSVRGFLSGTVRKKLKLNLISDVVGNGVRRYRVTSAGGDDATSEADQSFPNSSPSGDPVTDGAPSQRAG